MPRKQTTIERRFTSGEVEVRTSGKTPVIEGHAAVFDKVSQNLGGFVEVVQRGAFSKTLKESDVRALFNHDPNQVLGRSGSGTLRVSEDASGLYYEITPPDTSYARDLLAVMERGDVNQSSFAFFTVKDDWGLTDDEFPKRSLQEVGLVDVSPVTYPAYTDADSGLRTLALQGLSKRSHVPVEELRTAEDIKRVLTGETDFEDDNTSHTPETEPWARRARALQEMQRVLTEGPKPR